MKNAAITAEIVHGIIKIARNTPAALTFWLSNTAISIPIVNCKATDPAYKENCGSQRCIKIGIIKQINKVSPSAVSQFFRIVIKDTS